MWAVTATAYVRIMMAIAIVIFAMVSTTYVNLGHTRAVLVVHNVVISIASPAIRTVAKALMFQIWELVFVQQGLMQAVGARQCAPAVDHRVGTPIVWAKIMLLGMGYVLRGATTGAIVIKNLC